MTSRVSCLLYRQSIERQPQISTLSLRLTFSMENTMALRIESDGEVTDLLFLTLALWEDFQSTHETHGSTSSSAEGLAMCFPYAKC